MVVRPFVLEETVASVHTLQAPVRRRGQDSQRHIPVRTVQGVEVEDVAPVLLVGMAVKIKYLCAEMPGKDCGHHVVETVV